MFLITLCGVFRLLFKRDHDHLLELSGRCSVFEQWRHIEPRPSSASRPGAAFLPPWLRKRCALLRSPTNAHLMWQMLHHQGLHIWSEVTEWVTKSPSLLGQVSPLPRNPMSGLKAHLQNMEVIHWNMIQAVESYRSLLDDMHLETTYISA